MGAQLSPPPKGLMMPTLNHRQNQFRRCSSSNSNSFIGGSTPRCMSSEMLVDDAFHNDRIDDDDDQSIDFDEDDLESCDDKDSGSADGEKEVEEADENKNFGRHQ